MSEVEVLERAGAVYAGLESFTAKLEIRSPVAGQRGFGGIAFLAPNRFAVTISTETGTQRQVSDGVHFFSARSADPGQYHRLPMPRLEHGKAGLMQYRVFGPLTPFLAGVDLLQSGEAIASVEMAEAEACDISDVGVRVRGEHEETLYHIGRADSVIRRIDVTRLNAGTTASYLYSAIAFNAPLPDRSFRFAPPPRSVEAINAHDYLRAGLREGDEALAFEAIDVTGKPWRLADYAGRTILLDFWSSACAPCREENRNLQAFYARYHDRGLEIAGISADIEREPLIAYLAGHDLPWPQMWDGQALKGDIARLYKPRGVPTTILIGPDGRIVSVGSRGLVLGDEIVREVSR